MQYLLVVVVMEEQRPRGKRSFSKLHLYDLLTIIEIFKWENVEEMVQINGEINALSL